MHMKAKEIPSVITLPRFIYYPAQGDLGNQANHPHTGDTAEHPPEKELAVIPLSCSEKEKLAECEATISKGWPTFISVGKALAEIRNAKLYRGEFSTFEAYCREKWQYQKVYVYRLISAAELVTQLLPMGNFSLQHESQIRPLIGLSTEEAIQTLKKAELAAQGGEVTAKLIQAAALEFRPKKKRVSLRQHSASSNLKSKPYVPDSDLGHKLLELLKNAEYFVRNSQNPDDALHILAEVKSIIKSTSFLCPGG
jgi:hypothetical protein